MALPISFTQFETLQFCTTQMFTRFDASEQYVTRSEAFVVFKDHAWGVLGNVASGPIMCGMGIAKYGYINPLEVIIMMIVGFIYSLIKMLHSVGGMIYPPLLFKAIPHKKADDEPLLRKSSFDDIKPQDTV